MMTTEPGRTRTWNSWVVPWWIALAVLLIMAASIALAFARVGAARREAIYNTAHAACETSNEFRTFMAQYLTSQIPDPPDKTPGFERLPQETKDLIASLGPVLDSGRQRRAEFAATFVAKFPTQDCDIVAKATVARTP